MLWSPWFPDIPKAAVRTLEFAGLGISGALVLGMILALLKVTESKATRWPAYAYTELFKNTPLLVIVFIYYYGLPSIGVVLDPLTAGSLALATFYAAYLSEIFRAGIEGISGGQREAGKAVGLTGTQIYRYVVLPQAMRLALPGTGNMIVDLLKSTALMSVIAGAELLAVGQNITSQTFEPMKVYLVIGAVYFSMCYPLSQLVLWSERRIRRGKQLTPLGMRRQERQDALVKRILAQVPPESPSNGSLTGAAPTNTATRSAE